MKALDIPEDLKSLYKTVWEIKQRVLVDMAAGGAFFGGGAGKVDSAARLRVCGVREVPSGCIGVHASHPPAAARPSLQTAAPTLTRASRSTCT